MTPILQRLLAVFLLASALALAVMASRTPDRTWTVGPRSARATSHPRLAAPVVTASETDGDAR